MRNSVTTITDYARTHGLDPADMMAVIQSDPDGPPEHHADPRGRTISLRDGDYADGIYAVAYLDLIADHCAMVADGAIHPGTAYARYWPSDHVVDIVAIDNLPSHGCIHGTGIPVPQISDGDNLMAVLDDVLTARGWRPRDDGIDPWTHTGTYLVTPLVPVNS
jgi:hypothetical protein